MADLPEVFTVWNESALPKIRANNKERHKALQEILRSPFFRENWKEGITIAESSAFLTGTNDRGWKIDIDWFLKIKNFTKIIEGKYSNNTKPKPPVNTGHRQATITEI